MLISYDEYKEAGGKLDEAAYSIYGFETERLMIQKTFGRIRILTEPVKYCFVRICDIMEKADITVDRLSSWSNDGVSGSVEKTEVSEYNKKIDNIIYSYLGNETDEEGVPLLYLGGVSCD